LNIKFKPINYLRILALLYSAWIIFFTTRTQYYLIWNLFLAWIPLELSLILNKLLLKNKGQRKLTILIIVLGLLWLLFYPNAPYMVTDLIHLSTNKYYIANPKYTPYSGLPRILFSDDYKIWLNLINITIGVCIGWIFGFVSLYLNQSTIAKKSSLLFSWIFVIVINILSGFAIYLGRFIRWNSWDVITNPKNIISILTNDINAKSIYYTLIFGAFYLILYTLSFILIHLRESNDHAF
jgi:uncharacterized membrane protein